MSPQDYDAISESDLALVFGHQQWYPPGQMCFENPQPALGDLDLPGVTSLVADYPHGLGFSWNEQSFPSPDAAAADLSSSLQSMGADPPEGVPEPGAGYSVRAGCTTLPPSASSQSPKMFSTEETRGSVRPISNVLCSESLANTIGEHEKWLLKHFEKIVQPPAAILIGGMRKWRCLQRYLIDLGLQNQLFLDSLLCVTELLAADEDRGAAIQRSIQRHQSAQGELEAIMTTGYRIDQQERDKLLAALFLLAWFEVIHDHTASNNDGLFPRHLATWIIVNNCDWNKFSLQLLSWFNTLDSKATHLGGHPLLPPETLRIVMHYPLQTTTTSNEDEENIARCCSVQTVSTLSLSGARSCDYLQQGRKAPNPVRQLNTGYIKHIVLQTMVQPAIKWYLESQLYCRRISAYEKHNCVRSAGDAEYEVIIGSQRLEQELWELWRRRPTTMSLSADELNRALPPDVAMRLCEIYCVHLASFWILFVYLHRVIWVTRPHSPMVQIALEETWHNLQSAYGEVVDNGRERICHPALMWPLFLFGSECPDEGRRAWAIEQLEALGESKPVMAGEESHDDEALPPFKLSAGATLNARRAALLLKELTKRQVHSTSRIDYHDLSVELFGCYFSIV
ncbi:C6 finger domain-containing protein [Penicillium riverlandense]|uniref:C6 finger domain-containing protein n=1 Tax=Penicillium riverlandense TaxID=1903569 RepID=UPI00254956FA|nr:C6 finger domain-containing protein [Penicillium riverlandense]KAJ5833655.1 C6 finger domain-containing protein [Penicillium riverlandense]